MKGLLLYIQLIGTCSFAQVCDSSSISLHMNRIIKDFPNRNFQNLESLNGCASYIYQEFDKYADSTYYQEFKADKQVYKNVIASFGPRDAQRVVVGAHYDVCGNQDGADDNASGVVGLLELARLLQKQNLSKRIDLVAYSLEEPPYFRSEKMGSYVHAKYLKDNNIDVYGMICLEMIGYFSDEKKSQKYPLGILKMFYGGKGNYITLVKKISSGKMAKHFKRKFNKKPLIRTKNFTAPAKLTGIDFSDHLNYWLFDYSAVMVTNTGFYRNPNYHEKTDKIETLNLVKMAKVINQVHAALVKISS